MGSDESPFNVSLTVKGKVTRQRPQIKLFYEKGEPKRNQTEVLLLTSLTAYHWAKPADGVGPDPPFHSLCQTQQLSHERLSVYVDLDCAICKWTLTLTFLQIVLK